MTKYRKSMRQRAHAALLPAVLLGIGLLPGGARADGGSDEPTVKGLTAPTNSIEVGGGDVSSGSAKFGEYNGLGRQGAYGIGNFDLRGGGAYDSNDATRWRLSGSNLGLETRELRGEYGVQGRYRFSFGYDELLRDGSAMYETIQTPYLGAGGTNLSLPSNWKAPLYPTATSLGAGNAFPSPSASMLGLGATSLSSPLVTGTSFICRTTAGCSAAGAFGGAYTTGFPTTGVAGTNYAAMLAQNRIDAADFQTVRLSTKRQKQSYALSYDFSPQWSASFGVQREYKNGIKPLGVVNSGNGGYAGENSVTIPQLIDTTTDQFNASLNYRTHSGFLSFAYFGETFENMVPAMTLANPYATGAYGGVTQNAYGISSATISEEPSNAFHQLRLTGGYDLTRTTHLSADASYGRNTQNAGYVLDPAVFSTPTGGPSAGAVNNGSVVPATSANAVVVSRAFDLKLTARPLTRLAVDAAYKFDERANSTPVKTYTWYDAGAKNFGAATGTLNGATVPGVPTGTPIYSGVNVLSNRPYSKRLNDLSADADYTLAPGHSLRVGLDWQKTDRYCAGTWIDCSFADSARETAEKIEYRFRLSEEFRGRVAFDHGVRHVDYNPNAWMSLDGALGASAIPSLAALGYTGSVLGFLNANGLGAYGLPIAANAASGLSGTTLAVYQALFGTGNSALSNKYYGSNNITANWPGLDIYSMADRDRNRVRGSLDWQATDSFNLQGGMDYRRDAYPDSLYGLQSTSNWSLNLDGDLSVGEDLVVSAYYSHDDQRNKSAGNAASNSNFNITPAAGTAYTTAGGATGTNSGVVGLCAGDSSAGLTNPTAYQIYNNNLKTSPCTAWQSQTRDHADTLGLAFSKKRLFVPRLALQGDLSYSHAVSANALTGGSYASNTSVTAPYVAGAPEALYINAASMPDIVTNTVQLRLVGSVRVDKASTVRVAYSFSRLSITDYEYGTTLPANTSGSVMPVSAPAPNYTVNVVGVSYVYLFQ